MSAAPPFRSQLSPTQPLDPAAGFLQAFKPGTTCLPCQAAKAKAAAKRTPCDVAVFTLSDSQTKVTLTANGPLAGQPLPPKLPPHLKDALAAYDLVIERAVDYVGRRLEGPSRNAAAAKVKIKLQAKASFVGSCGASEHPLIRMHPLGEVNCEPRADKSWTANQTPTLELEGRPYQAAGSGVTDFFSPFWVFGHDPQSWTVVALACGIRDKGSAVTKLTGLVRAWAHDEYELSYTFPSAIGFSAERKGSVNVKGEWQGSKSASTSLWGQTQWSTETAASTQRDGTRTYSQTDAARNNGVLSSTSHELKMGANGQTQSYSQSTSDKFSASGPFMLVHGSATSKSELSLANGAKDSTEYESSYEVRPAMSLKKNGQEMDITKFLNNLFNLATRIKKAVEDIQKMVPSVGWKVSFELKLLEGSITGKWGIQNGEDLDPKDGAPKYQYTGDRYVAVRKYYGLEFNVVVFGATLTLMVGVEVKVDAVFWTVAELVIKLEGKLAGEAALKWAVTSDQEVQAPKLEATLKGTVSGVCKANAVGYHLVDASASLSGGLKFTGVPSVSLQAAPRIDGELSLMKTEAVYWGSVGKEPPEPVKVPLYDEKSLWSGNLLAARNP
jgi:hypothetical protein